MTDNMKNSNTPKRHHYVSQMHLNNFTDNYGKFYCYNKKSNQIHYTTARKAFFERHLYTIENEDGVKNTELEAKISKLEGNANRIIRKIVAASDVGTAPQLTANEKATWDLFFYMQWKRVPDMHETAVNAVESEGQLDEIFAALRQNYPDKIAEIENLNTPASRARLMKGAKVQAIGSATGVVLDYLSNRGISIVRVYSPGERFVIGSFPIVRLGGNLLREEVQAWLPITPNTIVGIGEDLTQVTFSKVLDPNVVLKVNRAVASQSTSFASPSRPTIDALVSSLPESLTLRSEASRLGG